MPIIPNVTLSYVVNLVNRDNSGSVVDLPLPHAAFNLDSSGVAGFFGGESAVRATATVNLVAHRRWLGWYNAPGSYEVARQYSGLARAHLFDALFPSSDSNPAKILMVDGRVGPEYTPLYSTTNTPPSAIEHLGSLIARKVSQMSVKEEFSRRRKGAVEPARVTFVKLNRNPLHEINELELVPNSFVVILGIITILISIGGCLGCILVADWFCLASIALGIIANGMACAVVGSGKLYLKHKPPAQMHTPGDVLLRTDTDIIVLVGNEGLVRPITHGRFDLRFRGMPRFGTQSDSLPTAQPDSPRIAQPNSQPVTQPAPHPNSQSHPRSTGLLSHSIPTSSQPRISQKYLMDISVILLLSQFLAQLLLIPQGTLFGQLMFVGTLVASWIYNSYLSAISLDLQTNMLFGKLSIVEEDDFYPYELNNWMEAVAFSCLFFRAIHPLPSEDVGQNPNDWRKRVDKKGGEEVAAKKERTEAEAEAERAEKEVKRAEQEAEEAQKTVEAEVAKKKPEGTEATTGATTGAATGGLIEAAMEAVTKAKKAVDAAKAIKQKATATVMDKVVLCDMKDKEKKKESKRAEVAEREYNSFQKFLDALLPHRTDVRLAFMQSLVRKIGETTIDPYAEFKDKPLPFKFEYKDTWVTVAEGENRVPNRDQKLLRTYQNDADNALIEWKHFCDITNIDIQSWHD